MTTPLTDDLVDRMRLGKQPEERAAEEERRKLSDAYRAEAFRDRVRRDDRPTLSTEALAPWLTMFANTTGRPMSLEERRKRPRLVIVQRCRSCGGDIDAPIPDDVAATADWMVDIAGLVRHAYQLHRCNPVETDLTELDQEQIDLHGRALELDMLRIGERLKAIQGVIAKPGKENPRG